ncbi:class D beta-lactamase [Runella zeae]|uniref:class D beta-lactamase n=1 Tax=Runella zeae TaxID=94255 RepID=UPI002357EB0C|nr:class D beta-lactamase [Runella zeae]
MKFNLSFFINLVFATTLFGQNIDFEKHFKACNQTGSFVLYDYQKKSYVYHNKADFTHQTTPASTFKIPNSLIALELGVVKDENEVLKWDGKKRSIDNWNADHDLKTAFKNSTVWFYQELARRIGKDNYKKYLSQINYGNRDISAHVDDFWLGQSIKISPKQQIELLVKLYENQLPFSTKTLQKVKEIMVREKGENYVIRAKTGWANEINPQWNTDLRHVGWYVGYVEKGKNVYFFATRIYSEDSNNNKTFGPCRIQITHDILKAMGII